MSLDKKSCKPCEGGVDPLNPSQVQKLLSELDPGWKVIDNKKIEKSYKFDDFQSALSFVNLVGQVAEKQGHHPDIEFGWGYAKITLWTHAINGLSENDFILAAKADKELNHQSKACY